MQAIAKSGIAISIAPTALLTACDNRSKNDGSGSATPIAMQAAWVNDAEFIGYFVAQEKGWFASGGINLNYLPGGPEIVADTVVLARKADIALTTPDTTVSAIVNQGARLKIIGAQYQKNPLGVVSLKKNGINTLSDLKGRSLAVPTANVISIQSILKLNRISLDAVRIVPYQYDPTPLIRGEVDATVDFVTDVPYAIRQLGAEPASFLLYDYGFKIFNDTVAVLEETLQTKRASLISWLRASRRGWEENFKNTSEYPNALANSYFRGNGRTIENEIFMNKAQMPLIESASGIYSMSDEAVEENVEALNRMGIRANKSMFVADLLKEV
jgi:ABC-type nitrate/sulfonate/bicarbonate transport system substrate-binding protein